MDRLSGYEVSAVVVEANLDDVRFHRYRSRMTPHAVLQSILTLQVRYHIPVVWAGSREGGEYVTHGLLAKFGREKHSGAVWL